MEELVIGQEALKTSRAGGASGSDFGRVAPREELAWGHATGGGFLDPSGDVISEFIPPRPHSARLVPGAGQGPWMGRSPCARALHCSPAPACRCPESGLMSSLRGVFTRLWFPRALGTLSAGSSLSSWWPSLALCAWSGCVHTQPHLHFHARVWPPQLWSGGFAWEMQQLWGVASALWCLELLSLAVLCTGAWQQARGQAGLLFVCGGIWLGPPGMSVGKPGLRSPGLGAGRPGFASQPLCLPAPAV